MRAREVQPKPKPVLYNRLGALRAERGLSRQQVAETIGVNFQTVGFIERGEYVPSLDLGLKLGELFSLPIEMIFSRKPLEPLSLAYARRENKSIEGMD